MFITFEGIDGCGKTTQARLLAEYLSRDRYTVFCFRDPGSTRLGEKIRRILIDGVESDKAKLFLYLAARAEMVQMAIRPVLDAGHIVICDRYIHSTLAYQSGQWGISDGLLKEMSLISAGGLEPDMTYLLDVSVDVANKRIERSHQSSRLDYNRAVEFMESVRERYMLLAAKDPKICCIDATRSIDWVQEEIRCSVDMLLTGVLT